MVLNRAESSILLLFWPSLLLRMWYFSLCCHTWPCILYFFVFSLFSSRLKCLLASHSYHKCCWFYAPILHHYNRRFFFSKKYFLLCSVYVFWLRMLFFMCNVYLSRWSCRRCQRCRELFTKIRNQNKVWNKGTLCNALRKIERTDFAIKKKNQKWNSFLNLARLKSNFCTRNIHIMV